MIYFNYSGSTDIVLQYDKSTGVTYTWNIINKDSNVSTIFSTADLSTSPYYIMSTITISTIEDLTGGTINIESGQYKYEIYEMNSPSLTLTNGTLIKNGLLTINSGIYTPVTKVTYNINNTQFKVNQNQNRI